MFRQPNIDECDHAEYEDKVKKYKSTSNGLGRIHEIVNNYVRTGELKEVCAENAVCTNTEARNQMTKRPGVKVTVGSRQSLISM